MRHALICMAVAIVLVSCNLPIASTPEAASVPTLTPFAAVEAPSATYTLEASPTIVSSPSVTPTARTKRTVVALSASPTGTPARELDCQVLIQGIGDGTHFNRNESFSVSWKVKNTGRAGWDADEVAFVNVGGAKTTPSPLVHLAGDVSPGNIVILTADMRAPRTPSSYTTIWSLRRGTEYFCRLSLTFRVD